MHSKTYEIVVTLANGFTACDCLTFGDEAPSAGAPGLMRFEELGVPFSWAHTDLNESKTDFLAVGPVTGLFMTEPVIPHGEEPLTAQTAVHGSVKRRASLISGDAFSHFGRTVIFDGFENPECSLDTCEAN